MSCLFFMFLYTLFGRKLTYLAFESTKSGSIFLMSALVILIIEWTFFKNVCLICPSSILLTYWSKRMGLTGRRKTH